MAITKIMVNQYPQDSAEYIVLHARWQKSRGRKPSAHFWWLRDPRKSLQLAKRIAYFPINGKSYLNGETPEWYQCSSCGAGNKKMWRMYGSRHIELRCTECAAQSQNVPLENIREDGRVMSTVTHDWGDTMSYLVPAIPDEFDPPNYWGYTSVPNPAVEWWRKLPTF